MGSNQSVPWQSPDEVMEDYIRASQHLRRSVPHIVKKLYLKRILDFGFQARWEIKKACDAVFHNVVVFRNQELERQKSKLNDTSFTIVGCRPSSEYKVVVYPRNAEGVINGPGISRIFWTDPTPIRGLRVNEDKGKIFLSWDEAEEDNIRYKINSYEKSWWGWNLIGSEDTNLSNFWLKSPTPGVKYRFTIQATNSHGLVGEKKEIYKKCTGKYTVHVYIVKKDPHDISVLYGLNEEELKNTLQTWIDDGYSTIRPVSIPIIMYSSRKYKSKLNCEARSVPVYPDKGHELEDQLLLDDHTVAYSFVARASERGKFVLEFKIEENGDLIKTEPFVLNSAGTQPLQQYHVQTANANFGENGGDVVLDGGGVVNVGSGQSHNYNVPGTTGSVQGHPVSQEERRNTPTRSWRERALPTSRRSGYERL
ncbi:uncharacterized protein LOC120346642 [Styela clava]